MRPRLGELTATKPVFQESAEWLMEQIVKLTVEQLTAEMKISVVLAKKVKSTHQAWLSKETVTGMAAATFVGDMYSGLQVPEWSESEWQFAAKHMRILSGLYGVLSPTDIVKPYRLEMAYSLKGIDSLYTYWADRIAQALPASDWILNLSVPEYTDTILPYLSDEITVVRPTFLTWDKKAKQAKPVVVHAKVARGAMARWVIQNRLQRADQLVYFDKLGYVYDPDLSTSAAPVFVCREFGGLGLSVRLD